MNPFFDRRALEMLFGSFPSPWHGWLAFPRSESLSGSTQSIILSGWMRHGKERAKLSRTQRS
jgi:hypothetical protein